MRHILMISLTSFLCAPLIDLLAAPVPVPLPRRPVQASELVGCWDFKWSVISFKATFCADGTYAMTNQGLGEFIGHWAVKDGVLYLNELQTNRYLQPHGEARWSLCHVKLSRTDAGVYSGTAVYDNGHTVTVIMGNRVQIPQPRRMPVGK